MATCLSSSFINSMLNFAKQRTIPLANVPKFGHQCSHFSFMFVMIIAVGYLILAKPVVKWQTDKTIRVYYKSVKFVTKPLPPSTIHLQLSK